MQHTGGGEQPLGPIDPLLVPRFAGPATYARLPRLDQVDRCAVAIVGVPFDGGVTYRPGARFGPAAIRAGSRLMRGYHPGLEVEPFASQQVADAGDIACTPFDIAEALVHFDAHLDTWDTYFGAAYTHGTPFRRAHEEGLLASERCAHVGIRGPLFTPQDLVDDAGFGFTIVGAFDYLTR